MRNILTIFLAFGILAQSFVQLGVVVYFELNRVYISQELCVNRNNPKMHCNGHCYLSKQLKKAEQGEQKQTQNFVKEKDEIVSKDNSPLSTHYFPSYTSKEFISYISIQPISDYRNNLVKPPTA